MSEETVYSNDLAGVIVGETAISDVQGEIGLLSYRGYRHQRHGGRTLPARGLDGAVREVAQRSRKRAA